VAQSAVRPKPGSVPLLPFPAQPVAQADTPAARRLASTLGFTNTPGAVPRGWPSSMYAIKTEVTDATARSWTFEAQKTMYGGKRVSIGDEVFVFASENEGGSGLIASGVVSAVEATPRKAGVERQTPRVSITVSRTALANRPLGRDELKPFTDWTNGGPETELNFKFYRQATNKIVGLSQGTAAFLRGFF
jgi:hypothetical protein